MNVLIVDDEPFQRESLRNLPVWEAEEWTVAGVAENGESALRFLETTPVDLVMTDARMPRMDGIRLAREIRGRYPSTRVVVLSAFDDFHLVKNSFRSGVYDYLLKAEADEDQIREILSRVRQEILEPSRDELRTRGYVTFETASRRFSECSAGSLSIGGRSLAGTRFVCLGYRIASPDDSALTRIGQRLMRFHRALPVRLGPRTIAAVASVPKSFDYGQVESFLQDLPRSPDWPRHSVGPVEWAAAVNPYFSDLRELQTEIATVDEKLEQYFFAGWGRLYRHAADRSDLSLDILKSKRDEFSSLLLRRSFAGDDPRSVAVEVPLHARSSDAVSRIRSYFQWTSGGFQDYALQNSVAHDQTLIRLIQKLSDDVRNESTLAELNEDHAAIFARLAALSANRHNLVSKAKAYVRSVLPGECYVADVAKSLGVTYEHLGRTFKAHESKSLKAYISEQRIRLAQSLMADSSKKMYEIAEAAGFSSVEHFSRTFKRVVGVSPKKYGQSVGE